MSELSHFEEVSAKTPVLPPIFGIAVFVMITLVILLFSGRGDIDEKYKKKESSESSAAAVTATETGP